MLHWVTIVANVGTWHYHTMKDYFVSYVRYYGVTGVAIADQNDLHESSSNDAIGA